MLFEGALISGGIMVSYWINYGFWFVTQYGSFQWRFPIAFQAVFGIMLIIGVLLYPESPRWLVKKGKYEAATTIMAVLEDKTEDDPDLLGDIEEMKRVNAITAEKLTPKELFSNGKEMNLWRLSVACLSQAFQQVSLSRLEPSFYKTCLEKDADSSLRRLAGWSQSGHILRYKRVRRLTWLRPRVESTDDGMSRNRILHRFNRCAIRRRPCWTSQAHALGCSGHGNLPPHRRCLPFPGDDRVQSAGIRRYRLHLRKSSHISILSQLYLI